MQHRHQTRKLANAKRAKLSSARGNSPAESPKRSHNGMLWVWAHATMQAILRDLHVKACERHGVSLKLKPIKSKRTAKRRQTRI